MKAVFLLICMLSCDLLLGQRVSEAGGNTKRGTNCITGQQLFQCTIVDSIFQWVQKPAFAGLLTAINNCGYAYQFDAFFQDIACHLLLPRWMSNHSLIFSNNGFAISFDDSDQSSADCIVLQYHFDKQSVGQKIRIFESMAEANFPASDNGVEYFITPGGMQAGRIFLNKVISISYYTNKLLRQDILRSSIASCRLE